MDDDGVVQIDDAVLLLTTLFRGGVAPAAPYPYPGTELGDMAINHGFFDANFEKVKISNID